MLLFAASARALNSPRIDTSNYYILVTFTSFYTIGGVLSRLAINLCSRVGLVNVQDSFFSPISFLLRIPSRLEATVRII